MKSPQEYTEIMLQKDAFSRWMQLKVAKVKRGNAIVEMELREEMLNGFGIAHGGIIFSLADSALAFASNGRGNISVALDVHIQYLRPVFFGDTLVATAEEVKDGRNTGVYQVVITNQKEEKIALFTGTVFRTGKSLSPHEDPHE